MYNNVVNVLFQEELVGVTEDDGLEGAMLGDKETNRKFYYYVTCKVIRDSTRVVAVMAKKNKLTGNKLGL